MISIRHLASVLSQSQKVALALSKPVSASLSLFASLIIIYKIYLRYISQPKAIVVTLKNDGGMTTYYRMLLSISILDVVHSISSTLNALLVPAYTNGTFAHGTTATCSVQGALQQLTPSIVIYMAMLNTYFMLKIRYNVPDAVITSRYEFWFHAIPLAHFLSTAITGLSMGIYGPIILTELGCWLDSYCVYTNTCTRSGPIFYNYIDYYAWSFAYIWLFICVLIVSINAVLIYTAIRKQERRNEKYLAARLQKSGSVATIASKAICLSSPHEDCVDADIHISEPTLSQLHDASSVTGNEFFVNNSDKEAKPNNNYVEIEKSKMMSAHFPLEVIDDRDHFDDTEPGSLTENSSALSSRRLQATKPAQKVKQSRIAAVQSLLYVTSALFTALWIFMPWVGRKLGVGTKWRFFFAFMVNIISPSQGLFNLFVFVRLHYLKLRESNTAWSRWKCVKQCLFSAD